jgi:hypothetical protein
VLLSAGSPNIIPISKDGTKNQVITLFHRWYGDMKVPFNLKGMTSVALKYTADVLSLIHSCVYKVDCIGYSELPTK